MYTTWKTGISHSIRDTPVVHHWHPSLDTSTSYDRCGMVHLQVCNGKIHSISITITFVAGNRQPPLSPRGWRTWDSTHWSRQDTSEYAILPDKILSELGFWIRLQLTTYVFYGILPIAMSYQRPLTFFEMDCTQWGPIRHTFSLMYRLLITPLRNKAPGCQIKWESNLGLNRGRKSSAVYGFSRSSQGGN